MRLLLPLLALLIWGCKTQEGILVPADQTDTPDEVIYDSGTDVEEYEERELDELVISAPREYNLPPYNPAEDRVWDLQHMDLDVRFDWTNEKVFGRADITMQPYFYEQSAVILDAQGFQIIDIASANGSTLDYEYDGKKLQIELGRTYKKGEEALITIDYVAHPAGGPSGGSNAIVSDQGLFFIDPRDEDPEKPTQIWTQGETEHNSRWFPTIDKPNEQITHQVSMTVDDNFVTLSNGTLTESKSYGDGTRKDCLLYTSPSPRD